MSIFKACDIRGIAGEELTPAIARKIGNATAHILKAKQLVIGHDMRLSSRELSDAFISGATDAGCDIIDIGLVPTETCYFAISHLSAEGGVMVTASHNPANYNGFKVCSRNSTPVDYANGINQIEQCVQNDNYIAATINGTVCARDILGEYLAHISQYIPRTKKMRIVADTGNGMAGALMPFLSDKMPDIEFIPLFWELDGSFPNHGPNPMTPSSTEKLREAVVTEQADFGISFDGDADRLIFVDEKGHPVSADVILMLTAGKYLKNNPGATVVYDLRCSRAVPEFIDAHGGVPIESKVGHTNVKLAMRANNAIFAGELSGHYYFRENYFSDSSSIMMLHMLEVISNSGKPLSQLVQEHSPYVSSGEISFHVTDQQEVINELDKVHVRGKHTYWDGLTVRHKDWWFNIRASITEPYVRLNIEARDSELLELKKQELHLILDKYTIF